MESSKKSKKLSQRQLNAHRREEIYALLKYALKNKPKDKKVQDVYDDIAREYSYESWQCIGQIYQQLKKKDPSPLENFKVKKEGGRKNQHDKPKND